MQGFAVELLDQNGAQMAITTQVIKISGITEPTKFKYYEFNYKDRPHSGIYAIH